MAQMRKCLRFPLNANTSSLIYCLKLVSTGGSINLYSLSTKAQPTIKSYFAEQLIKPMIAVFMFSLKTLNIFVFVPSPFSPF